MEDFVYWPHPTAVGIRVEEISGGKGVSPKAWLPMARQIFAENGKDTYREIIHTPSGAPLLDNIPVRISVSHSPGLLVIAMLKPVPDTDLEQFSLETALGVDTERSDRAQVLKIRERFLSATELEMIPADDIELNILAWTVKEAVYKALLSEGTDWRNDIIIERLPEIADYPLQNKTPGRALGIRAGRHTFKGQADYKDLSRTGTVSLELFAYRSDDNIVCLTYSPKSAGVSENTPQLKK